MPAVADSTLYWAVLARTRGEVLTAEAQSPGLHLGLLGVPEGFADREVEGWLYDVVGVAHEADRADSAAQPIPTLLHHALSGLLFSHGELWERAGSERPCSFAFAHTVHQVGFGWVGDAEVSVILDGRPIAPEWVRVRDEHGREARGWSTASIHSLQVCIAWQRKAADAAAGGAEVEAVWSGAPPAAGEPVGVVPAPALEAREAEPVSAPPPAPAHDSIAATGSQGSPVWAESQGADEASPASGPREDARASGSPGWLRRSLSWLGGRWPEERGAPAGGVEPLVTPASDTASGDLSRAADSPREEDARETASRPERIPPTPEPETALRPEPEALTPPSVAERLAGAPSGHSLTPPVWRGATEKIPPTPEPAALTGRTKPWMGPSDPHAIELPPPAVAPETAPPAVTLPEPTPPDEVPALATVARQGLPAAAGAAAIPSAERAEAMVEPWLAPTPRVRTPSHPATLRRPDWPTAQQLARRERAPWQRPWVWLVMIAVLFAGGWLVGAPRDNGGPRDASRRGPIGSVLHAIGLGGPRYVVEVTSHPPGAWIVVDGRSLTLRTPAAIELSPGEHAVNLSFSDLGGASFTVRGVKGDHVPLDARLWGTLEIESPGDQGSVAVSVDGEARGFAPMRIDSLTPGVHELRFSRAGTESWGQTVDVRVGETKEVLARAVQSPASGVLQVQARLTDAQGTEALKGGQVWIDGELRGLTPLTLDLSRGPHSVRTVYKGQQAPVQVIDLPGGNQRFAVFEFGTDVEVPQLAVDLPPRLPRDRPIVLSATLQGVAGDVREMWLHVQVQDGPWRRYGMTLLKSPAGIVGATAFPLTLFDSQGRARYYVSAEYGQGDEAFTEIRVAQLEKPPAH